MRPVAPLTRGEDRCLHWITRADFTGKGVAITEEELAFHLGYKRPYVSALVNGLADKGYMTIERRRHPGSPFRHNFYRVNVWNPHVRRGICNLRAEFQRVKAKRLREAECASSDSERTATASKGSCPGGTPSLRASKALPGRSREARIEIRSETEERMAEETKRCTYCQQVKPCDAFAPDARNRSGLQSRCRDCQNAWRRADFARNPERRQRRREWKRDADRKAAANRVYRETYPERAAAHRAVEYALRRGLLTRPDTCETCGSAGRPEAHHDDYAEQLTVRWLCRACHASFHRAQSAA